MGELQVEKASIFVKVPKERIGVLIGPGGSVKEQIEENLCVKLRVDSETGSVNLSLGEKAEDPSQLFKAKEIIVAIGRGLSPRRAFSLLEEGTVLKVIDLREILGKSESNIKRCKGRVIGKNGKTRRLIEQLTEAGISVYGHTITIVGDSQKAEVAENAVMMLLRGSQHRTVYQFLYRKRREIKKRKMELWKTPDETNEN
jgi:ribosomal RNA assembly protein